MRQLSTKLILALGMLLPLFYGCGNDDDGPDILPPTVSSPDDIEVDAGATATLSYSVSSSGGYASATAVSSTPAAATVEVTSEPADGSANGTVEITVTGVAEGQTTVTLTVTDDQNQDASGEVTVTVNAVETGGPGDTFASPGDTIASIADLSALATALDTAGLVETLNGDDPYTIFAPNNAAFTALLESAELEDLDALIAEVGTEVLADLLQGHVVNDSLSSVEVAAKVGQDSTETLSGAKLGFTQEGDNFFVNGAQIVQADIFTSNGVIHVIDSVINLPTGEEDDPEDSVDVDNPVTVADTIATIDALNSLEAALTATNLVEPLQGEGPFTVFAPNNEAFDALLAAEQVVDLTGLIEKLGEETVTSILQAHVVADSLPADLLEAGDYETLNGSETLTVTTEGETVFVDGAQVLSTNILANNGVVHIIDAVVNLPMAPPVGSSATVVDTIASREDLSVLEDALMAASLTEPLRGTGPFTVFAPDNDAFAALLEAQEVTTLEELVAKIGIEAVTDILQAHVVSGQVLTSDVLFDQNVYTSLEGSTLTITTDNQGTRVNGALITEADLATGNGVVHIIDQVVNTTAGNSGANGFTVTIENVSSDQRFFQQGTFGVTDGVAVPAGSYQFSFHAGPIIAGELPTKLSLVAKVTGTADQFIATPENGIALYDQAGQPVTGDLTAQMGVYDASTKDETGADIETPGPVQAVGDATGIATVSITNDGTLFTVTITDGPNEGGISPGVFGVHTVNTPIFGLSRSAGSDGLEELAEEGDPTALSTTLAVNEGFVVPLSAGVFAIHPPGVTPILVPEQADFGQGLEALAEDGDNSTLAASLATNQEVDSSGTFAGVGPGESVSFVIENAAPGDVLSLATMMVQSNDIVYATSEVGIPLFINNEAGRPVNGNVTPQLFAYDAGTEANEYPGAGPNQPLRQAAANTGPADSNNLVRRVTTNDINEAEDGYIYRPVNQRLQITITPNP